MRFEIETGIPLPPPPRATGRPAKYPLLLMRPGDSFFVCGDEKLARRIRMAISSLKKRGRLTSDVKFTVRKTADGYRCWRVK